jgi:hypothetical protein
VFSLFVHARARDLTLARPAGKRRDDNPAQVRDITELLSRIRYCLDPTASDHVFGQRVWRGFGDVRLSWRHCCEIVEMLELGRLSKLRLNSPLADVFRPLRLALLP